MAAPTKTKWKLFDSPKLDSRIRSANTQGSEQAPGCFSQSWRSKGEMQILKVGCYR